VGNDNQGKAPSKHALTPHEWRSSFKRVYERDQCLPGSVYAALVSADKLLGTEGSSVNSIQDLNRSLGYARGYATPCNATRFPAFQNRLASAGLEWSESRDPTAAYNQLLKLVDSDECSFPIVGVGLGLCGEYDKRTKFSGDPSDNDHALLILAIKDNKVHFFDPTYLPNSPTDEKEVVGLATFMKFWSEDAIEQYYRGWALKLTKARKPTATIKRSKGVRSLNRWLPKVSKK